MVTNYTEMKSPKILKINKIFVLGILKDAAPVPVLCMPLDWGNKKVSFIFVAHVRTNFYEWNEQTKGKD